MQLKTVVLLLGIISASEAISRGYEGCGTNYTGMAGFINSPLFGLRDYVPSLYCTWTITVPVDMVIEMQFRSIDIEEVQGCIYDGVIIYEQENYNSVNTSNFDNNEFIGKRRFCGNQSYPVQISKTNEVGILFYTDESTEGAGFQLKWMAIPAIRENDFNCTFDRGLCAGWTNVRPPTDNFDWDITSSSTQTERTGPQFDHTLNNENGQYAFIESSSPQVIDDTAILMSPQVQFNGFDYVCVSFWYHMYGEDIGTLLVAKNATGFPVWWFRTGPQGQNWLNGKLQIKTASEPVTLAFIGIRGIGFNGDIALDDVTIAAGNCSGDVQSSNNQGELRDFYLIRGKELVQPPPPPTDASCGKGMYRCISGTACILEAFLCNNIVDCPDEDDEIVCEEDSTDYPSISPLQGCEYDGDVQCANGSCVAYWNKCNGIFECTDGEDEVDCQGTTNAVWNEFTTESINSATDYFFMDDVSTINQMTSIPETKPTPVSTSYTTEGKTNDARRTTVTTAVTATEETTRNESTTSDDCYSLECIISELIQQSQDRPTPWNPLLIETNTNITNSSTANLLQTTINNKETKSSSEESQDSFVTSTILAASQKSNKLVDDVSSKPIVLSNEETTPGSGKERVIPTTASLLLTMIMIKFGINWFMTL